MKNKFGLPQVKSEYDVYKDSNTPVRISQNNEYSLGFVFDESSDFLYLKPSYIPQNFPLTKESSANFSKIEEEIPQKIRKNIIQKVEPVDWAYIKNLVNSQNKISSELFQEEIAKGRIAPNIQVFKK